MVQLYLMLGGGLIAAAFIAFLVTRKDRRG